MVTVMATVVMGMVTATSTAVTGDMVTPAMVMGTDMDMDMRIGTVTIMVMVTVAAGGTVTGMAGADHAGRVHR
jgi:hypothetical protein